MTGRKMLSTHVWQVMVVFSHLLRCKMLLIICQFLYIPFALGNLECMEYSQSRDGSDLAW